MSIPAGITTATVHMDAPVSFIGTEARLHVSIEPSVPLIWTATGTPIGNFTDTLNLDAGIDLSIDLPHTNQAGFQDAQGNAYTNWYYSVAVVYERDGRRISFPKRDFQIPVGQTSVDLALVPAGGAAPVPQIAPIQPVTSLNGRNGAVTINKTDVGLPAVDNTADTVKPVSGPQQAALDLKANQTDLAAHTSNVANPHAVTKAQVGLPNADNTSDAAKPVSTATQSALNLKADQTALSAHTGNVSNPHAVTKAQVGLGSVDNTADTAKPVSVAQQAALDAKQAKASLDADAAALLAASGTALNVAGNTAYVQRSNNLSDLASPSSARTNLGLGDAATHQAADFAKTSVLDVRAYGGTGDAVALTDATVTAASTTLTSATAAFTAADVGKTLYLMCTGPQIFKTTIASVQSAGSLTLAAAPPTGSWILGGPNVDCVYGTDNTAAFNQAFTDAQAAAVAAGTSRARFAPRNRVLAPAGNYLICSPLTPLTISGLELSGSGSATTKLWFNEPGALLSMGAYNATPSTAYDGTANDFRVQGVTIGSPIYTPTSFENARVGVGLQDNGSGGALVSDAKFLGLKYGFNGAYGSDFTRFTHNVFFGNCDVGAYLGVGSQQMSFNGCEFATCREGAVFEGAPQWYMSGCSFEDPLLAAVVLEAKTTGTTRSGVPVALSGAAYTTSAVISGTWFESNAGGSGRLASHMIFISGDAPNSGSMGGLMVRDSYLVSGGAQVSGAHNAFIEMNSTSFVPNFIDNLQIRGSYINHVARYSGTFATCNWVIVKTLPPAGGTYVSGPSGSVITDNGAGTMQGSQTFQQITATVAALMIQQQSNGGGAGELFKARSQTSSAALSGIALGGALFGAKVSQTLATAGAVTIDASATNVALVTLSANATSSTITNPHSGQRLTLSWIQDATGGRTYVWPTNCKFAGGAAPSDTTAGKSTSVTFVYDGTNWMESGRAVAVG